MNEDNARLIQGFSVPKISTLEDMAEVDSFLRQKETQYKLPEATYKVIPWLETAKAIVNANDILKKYRHRIEAAAFGGKGFHSL